MDPGGPLGLLAVAILFGVLYALYLSFIAPRFNPLQRLCGLPVKGIFGNHMSILLECVTCHVVGYSRSRSDIV